MGRRKGANRRTSVSRIIRPSQQLRTEKEIIRSPKRSHYCIAPLHTNSEPWLSHNNDEALCFIVAGVTGTAGDDGDPEPPAVRVLPSGSKETVSLADLVKDSVSKVPDTPKEKVKDGLVYICEGIPPLPAKIVQSIEKGEFVELTSLLPKNALWEEEPFTEITDKVVVFTHGKVGPKKKAIENIETWIEAFCTYAAVRGRKHPEDIPELMAYTVTIVKGARDYGGRSWLVYDYRFRQLAAAKQMRRGWGQKDMALWNDTFLRPKNQQIDKEGAGERNSSTHSQKRANDNAQSTVSKRQKKSSTWKSQICYPFSYGGKCTRAKCEYRHVCYDCGGDHSQSSCPKKDST